MIRPRRDTGGRTPHVVGWAVLLALVATTPCACSPGTGDAGHDRIRAIVMPWLTMVPFHIAAEEGYFARQGLDVEFIRMARTHDVMAALATGEVDVAAGLLTLNEINQIASGARLRMVAALGELDPEGCTYTAIVARREHLESGALEDPERIRRLIFDIDVLRPLGYWTDQALRPLGLTIDDLRVTYVPPPATVEAMRSGAIDVTLESEPFLTMMEATGETAVWQPVGKLLPGYVLSMLQYGRNLLDERPDVGERFAVAMLEAIRRYRLGKTPENLAIVQRATGLSPEQTRAACWPQVPADGRIDTSILRGYQEWSLARGLIERIVDDQELVERRFIDHANAELPGPEE